MKDYPISATIVEEIKSYEHSLPPYEIKSDIPKQERKYGLHAYSPLMGDKDSAPAALSENSLEAQRQRYSSGQSPPLPKPPCSGLAPKAETLAGMSHPLGPDTLLAGRQKAITSSTTQARAHWHPRLQKSAENRHLHLNKNADDIISSNNSFT